MIYITLQEKQYIDSNATSTITDFNKINNLYNISNKEINKRWKENSLWKDLSSKWFSWKYYCDNKLYRL